MSTMKPLDWVAIVLLIVGGLNWGSIGLFNFDFVLALVTKLGLPIIVDSIIKIIVGVGALYSMISLSLARLR